jgi:hypothetical protein
MLEKLRNDIRCKYVRVFDEECFTILRPAKLRRKKKRTGETKKIRE